MATATEIPSKRFSVTAAASVVAIHALVLFGLNNLENKQAPDTPPEVLQVALLPSLPVPLVIKQAPPQKNLPAAKAEAKPTPAKVETEQTKPVPTKTEAKPTPAKAEAKPVPTKAEVKSAPAKVETKPAPAKADAKAAPSRTAVSSAPAENKAISTPVAAPPASRAPESPAPVKATPSGETSGADYKADYLSNPHPPYPRISRRLGEEGRVLLRVLVSADGRALQIQLAQSSGFGRLDEAAQAGVTNWRFKPAKRNGQPVEGWVTVPINFTLKE